MRPLWVFAFGSLMYEPEHPDALLGHLPARWEGWRRALNKRSHARGCDRGERRWPDLPVRPDFVEGARVLSLALGAEPDPAAFVAGRLLRYDPDARDEVLARLDAREGYDPADPDSGYLREEVTVQGPDGPERAVVYRTNPGSSLYTGVLAPAEAAAIVLAATPVSDHPARGIDYVLGAVRTLARGGLTDPRLDAVVAAATARVPIDR